MDRKEKLKALLIRLIDNYPEIDFVEQIRLSSELAGFDSIEEMTEEQLLKALDNRFDQLEVNDLFIEGDLSYSDEEDWD